MSGYGYVIAQVEVKDPEAYRDYVAQAPATITRYGGEYLVRGGSFEGAGGEWPREPHGRAPLPERGGCPAVARLSGVRGSEGAPQPGRAHQHGG